MSLFKTTWLRDTIERLQAALLHMPDGRLTRQGLIDGGFLPDSQFYPVHFGLNDPFSGYRPFAEAAKLEYTRKVKIELQPDTPAEDRGRANRATQAPATNPASRPHVEDAK